MGCALECIAVRGKSRVAILNELELEGTGDYEDIHESPITGLKLGGGWYVVIDQRCLGLPAKQLSIGCEVITCSVEEHVMYSAAVGWKDGQEIWSIYHDSSQGIEHLKAKGELPPKYPTIRDRLLTAQKSEGTKPECDHVFSIPVEVVKALTGFAYLEKVAGAGDVPFEVLDFKCRPRESFVGRLLGALGLRRFNSSESAD